MSMSEVEVRRVVAEAIKAQLESPARALVNGEAAFVAQRLRDSGYPEVATRYWYWTCLRENREEFGDEIYELQMKLREIDQQFELPQWGTYGT